MFPLRDTEPSRCVPIATYSIIGLNVIVFFWEVGLKPHQLELVLYKFGLVPACFNSGLAFQPQYSWLWMQWFTHMFLHGGWLHLIGNMWTLWIFGDNVEDRMGPHRFILFYVLCGLGAALVQYSSNPQAQVPMVGASGAIAGVMGAYYLLFPRSLLLMLLPPFFLFVVPAPLYLAYWFLYQWLGGFVSFGVEGGVAWWAHLGGFGTGMLLHRAFIKYYRGRYPRYYCFSRAKEI